MRHVERGLGLYLAEDVRSGEVDREADSPQDVSPRLGHPYRDEPEGAAGAKTLQIAGDQFLSSGHVAAGPGVHQQQDGPGHDERRSKSRGGIGLASGDAGRHQSDCDDLGDGQ